VSKPGVKLTLPDPGVYWSIILQWILMKWDGEHGPNGSIKCGEFLD